ncbi:unnamed protein product [Ixodes persulcatus]
MGNFVYCFFRAVYSYVLHLNAHWVMFLLLFRVPLHSLEVYCFEVRSIMFVKMSSMFSFDRDPVYRKILSMCPPSPHLREFPISVHDRCRRSRRLFLALFWAFRLSQCTMPVLNPIQSTRLLGRTTSHHRHFLSACVGSGCLCPPSIRIRCKGNSKLWIYLGKLARARPLAISS